MQFLYNKTHQVEFDNIHAFILAGMSTNRAELAKVNGYGSKAVNDEAANYFTLFTLHFPHA